MDRITGANYQLVGGLRMWQDRNLAANQEGTFGNALWFNGVQEELMAVIAAGGLTPNSAANNQVITAILKLIAAANNAYLNDYGYWYFGLPVAGLSSPLIFAGGPVTLPAGVLSVQQLLPTSFQNSYIGGYCTDGGAGGYTYGVAAGSDLSHVEIFCPTTQLIYGAINTRGSATGRFIVVGW